MRDIDLPYQMGRSISGDTPQPAPRTPLRIALGSPQARPVQLKLGDILGSLLKDDTSAVDDALPRAISRDPHVGPGFRVKDFVSVNRHLHIGSVYSSPAPSYPLDAATPKSRSNG